MEGTKLVYFLRKLSGKEVKAFKTYVHSPFFNDRDALKKLITALEKELSKGKGIASKEQIYQRVYGDKSFNEASLKTNMTQLFGLLRDFMSFTKYKADLPTQNMYFLQKLNELSEEKYFEKYYGTSVKDLEKTSMHAGNKMYARVVLEEEAQLFRDRRGGRNAKNFLSTAIGDFGNSFLLRMLRYQIILLNRQLSFTGKEENEMLGMALEHVANNLNRLPLSIQVHYQLYLSLKHPLDSTQYAVARQELSDNAKVFSSVELSELYTSILNMATRQLNEGDLSFLQRIFDLYKEMLELEIIIERNRMLPWHFKNIVNVGARLKQFAWVEAFIEEWQDKILNDYAENAYNFNQGMLKYYQQSFEAAERHFHTLLDDYKDVFYGLNARGYLLQIYFETENLRGLEALAHSFRMFLDRSKDISEEKRRQYINFINHLRKLINIPTREVDKLTALKKGILEKDRKGLGSAWLVDKIEGLIREGAK